jgi:ABC-type uncharacterized transport system substrate-binding protein
MLLGFSATMTRADIGSGEMLVIGRALSFLQKPMTGEITVGIVYSSANAESVREADLARSVLASGLTVGNLTLKAQSIPIAEIARAHVDLLFLTSGLGSAAQAVQTVSSARQIPCATTDIIQVRNGLCALGIRSEPRVEILVNRAAAAASGTAFSTVFRMMITEI